MGRPSPEQQAIPLINSKMDYPIPLTDRFGDFWESNELDRFWLKEMTEKKPWRAAEIKASLEGLKRQYGNDFDSLDQPLRTGDPRQFMSEEITFVSFYGGEIGIHAEFELDLEGSADELSGEIEKWQKALYPLDRVHNHTRFFLALGDVTYKGRLTLNAFTTLKNGRLGSFDLAPRERYLMVSPYHAQEKADDIESCSMISEVVQVLINMGLYDMSLSDAIHTARSAIRKQQAA